MSERESDAEAFLCKEIRKLGGIAYKFVSPGNDGVPDRLLLMPGGKAIFVEMKTQTGKLRSRQKIQIERIRERGFTVETLHGKQEVSDFLKRYFGKEAMPHEVHST